MIALLIASNLLLLYAALFASYRLDCAELENHKLRLRIAEHESYLIEKYGDEDHATL